MNVSVLHAFAVAAALAGALSPAVASELGVQINSTPPVPIVFSQTPGIDNLPQINFAPVQPFAVEAKISVAKSVDLNDDGRPDLIVADSVGGVSVLINTTMAGADTVAFRAPQLVFDGVATGVETRLLIADINGDGKPDLLVPRAERNGAKIWVLLNTSTPGTREISFATPIAFAVDDLPEHVTVAEINGDGKPDLVLMNGTDDPSGDGEDGVDESAEPTGNAGSVLLNITEPGSSSPQFMETQRLAAEINPAYLVAADVTADGKADLLITDDGGKVWTLINTTQTGSDAPTFAAPQGVAAQGSIIMAETAELNGDGKPDLVLTQAGGRNLAQLNATTRGSKVPQFLIPTAIGSPIDALADIDGDGKSDLIVRDSVGRIIGVRLNMTAPGASVSSFSAALPFSTPANAFVGATDVNGDGRTDLIVADNTGNTISVLLNLSVPKAAVPTFAAPRSFATTGEWQQAVISVDVNADSKPDIIVARGGSHAVSVWLNTTPHGDVIPDFSVQHDFAAGNAPDSVAAADMNGDHKPDLIVGDGAAISVLLNTTEANAGVPSFASRHILSADNTGFIFSSVAAADMNGDGKPDLIATAMSALGYEIVVALNRTADGAASPSFAAPQRMSAERIPVSVAAADINGDGKPDLIVTSVLPGHKEDPYVLTALINTTSRNATTATFAQGKRFPVGYRLYPVAILDVNGDGRPDLVVTSQLSGTISILLNATAHAANEANFTVAQPFHAGAQPACVASADIDGDGKLDLVVADSDGASASVLMNATARNASRPDSSTARLFDAGNEPVSVASADINGDGKPDVIVANRESATFSVLLNTTAKRSATFPTAPPLAARERSFPLRSAPMAVSATDINSDGRLDLITASGENNTLSILLNTSPDGTRLPGFAEQQAVTLHGEPKTLAPADINGDGKPDLIVTTDNQGGEIEVVVNATAQAATTSVFAQPQRIGLFKTLRDMAVGDVSGDGKPDLILANDSDCAVTLLLNTTPPNGSAPSFAAPETYATGSPVASVTLFDVNADGQIDVIVTDHRHAALSILLNTGAADGAAPRFGHLQHFDVGHGPAFVAGADVNQDGKPDLIVTDDRDNTVSVLLNSTARGATVLGFATGQSFAIGEHADAAVVVLDVNHDRKPDLIIGNGRGTISVLVNHTEYAGKTASFAARQTIAAPLGGPYFISAADLDGDGAGELLIANFSVNEVSVMSISRLADAVGQYDAVTRH